MLKSVLSAVLAVLLFIPFTVGAQETVLASGAKVNDPTNTGAASAAIPIEVPPGRKGIAPNLALNYGSNGGNGWLGVGWDLSLGEIQRSTKWGVNYSSNDYIYLGGGASSELVARADWGSNYYGAKLEGAFNKFYFNSSTGGWEVTDKSGTKYFYGSTAASRQDNQYGTFKWYLDRVQDLNGNYMTVSYWKDQGEVYLDRIDYAGNTAGLNTTNYVKCSWEGRDDATPLYASNSSVKTAYRLKTIEVYGNGQLARKYILDYSYSASTNRSILTSVTPYGNDGATTLPATTFSYQNGWSGWSPAQLGNFGTSQGYSNNSTFPIFAGDFNGDGKTDIGRVYSDGVRVYLSDGAGGWSGPLFLGNFGSSQGYGDANTHPMVIGDFNGDGKTDIGRVSNDGIRIYLSDGAGGWGDPFYLSSFGPNQGYTNYNSYPIFTGDFNGDGKTDIGRVYSDGVRVYLSDGAGGWSGPFYLGNFGSNQGYGDANTHPMVIGDFNGDGKTDIGRVYNDGIRVYLSDGAGGWGGPLFLNTFGPNQGYTNYNTYPIFTGDFNGDGKTDIGRVHSSGFTLYLSDGRGGWQSYGGIEGNFGTAQGFSDANIYPMVIGDFNGDGKTDVGRVSGSGIGIYLSDGNGAGSALSNLSPAQGYANGNTNPLVIGDFNGDGKIDIGRVSSDDINIQQVSPPSSDLLSTITNGLGGITTISYTSSSSYPNTLLPFVVQTVSSISGNDGNGNISTTSYTYTDGLFNIANREFRGFSYLKATDPAGTTTETWFRQDDIYKGLAYEQIVKDASGNTYTRTANTYDVVSPCTGVNRPFLVQKDNFLYDGAQTYKQTTASFEYDQYGNITRKYLWGDTSVAGDEKDEYIIYEYDTANWLLTRPFLVYIVDGNGELKAQTRFSYDSKGNVKSKTQWLDGGESPVTSYDYDAYGNQTLITAPKRNTTKIEYDTASYTYPTAVTNALNQTTTTTYDLKTGRPATQTDPNGNTVIFRYDTFGRLIETVTPTSGTSAYAWQETYFDGFGRTIRTKKSGPEGKSIFMETRYDNRGLVYATSLPYFADSSGQPLETIRWTYYAYDPVGRVREVTNPDTTKIIKGYLQGRTVLIDANGHQKVEERDVYGNLIRVEEYTGTYPSATLYATTTYKYDALGNLINTIDAKGNQITITYDTLSRKRSMQDPDMGYWTYTYDANGNLASQKDGKGQIITFEYDVLGRLKKKLYPNGSSVVYTYDEPTSTNPIGRLTTVADLSGTRKYDYDSLGRPLKETNTIDGVVYSLETTYDTLGRAASVKYPDGEIVNYGYDGAGNLTQVPGYVTFSNFNALGQPGTINYANGVNTINQYDPLNNRLYSITSNSPASGGLLNLAYTYDNVGNLKKLDDIADATRTQTFEYDDLNRLTQAQSSSYGILTYNYDQIGNITFNSQLGTYTYGARPHAVAQAGSNSYAYDDNGNMISRAGRTITYDYDNMPVSIVGTTGTVQAVYDYSGQRVKKITSSGTTIYIGQLYECKDNICTKYIFAGSTRIASKTTTSTLYYHGDHLGSASVITDASGTRVEELYYFPFGKTRLKTGSVDVKHKFTDQEEDPETGLYYYGARYYDPELGRFISADDIVQDPSDPQAFNRYSYVRNNPHKYIDPTGNWWDMDIYNYGGGGGSWEYSYNPWGGDPFGGHSTCEWFGTCSAPAPAPAPKPAPAPAPVTLQNIVSSSLNAIPPMYNIVKIMGDFDAGMDLIKENVYAPIRSHLEERASDRYSKGYNLAGDINVLGIAFMDNFLPQEGYHLPLMFIGGNIWKVGVNGVKLTAPIARHILQRHAWWSNAPLAGKFAEGTNIVKIKSMIDLTVNNSNLVAKQGGRYVYEYDFGKTIGTHLTGEGATRLRVVTDGTKVITTYPIK